jgi:hypothetical protein
MDGKYEATFIRAVDQLRARKLGARILELPTMAMIEGVTLTTKSGSRSGQSHLGTTDGCSPEL